ncbi:MAG: hypothetical protein JWP18_932 [Solirubrobacterales bacterium]|nr:hypothetical protein [Solirubrobacterales bacterium]
MTDRKRAAAAATCVMGALLASAPAAPAPTGLRATTVAAAQDHGGGDHAAGTADAAVAVSAGFSTFSPDPVRVLPGELIRWSNDSARAHTVTADDGRLDSGRLLSGESYTARVQAPGDVPYHCELHAGMAGTLQVRTILLDTPAMAAAPRRPFPLSGRAALAPGTEVRLQADTGAGFTDVGRTTTDAEGHFSVRVVPPGSGELRAVTGDQISPPVPLRVLDRRVQVRVARTGGRDVVRVRVIPADPGARVVLSLAIPERFGWWPARQMKLDSRSEARFVARTRRRLRARVVLTLADGATPLARSRVFHVGAAGR